MAVSTLCEPLCPLFPGHCPMWVPKKWMLSRSLHLWRGRGVPNFPQGSVNIEALQSSRLGGSHGSLCVRVNLECLLVES